MRLSGLRQALAPKASLRIARECLRGSMCRVLALPCSGFILIKQQAEA